MSALPAVGPLRGSRAWFGALVGAVALERVAELVVSQRNIRWALERGGVETGRGHYPAMVAMHLGLLVAGPVEVALAGRRADRRVAVPAVAAVAGAQALRWWCIRTLGPQWNTRVVVVPGLPLVRRGPYRWLRHPNYVAVVVEGAALPLAHGAWVTSAAFTLVDAAVLTARLRAEEAALAPSRQL